LSWTGTAANTQLTGGHGGGTADGGQGGNGALNGGTNGNPGLQPGGGGGGRIGRHRTAARARTVYIHFQY
jgi:hypothetical protein